MMSEWGIPFDYIEDNWDDAQFALMGKMLAERLDAKNRAASGKKQRMDIGQWMQTAGIK
jgi:hypothetical protein